MSHPPTKNRDERALLSLDGLSVGDAFGQCFFAYGTVPYVWEQRISNRIEPPPPWTYTDDTEMALGILEVLRRHGGIDQDDLAQTFARRYARNDRRGYGGMAHRILMEIGAGRDWREASSEAFDGKGSLGNGGAMRAAPLGAFFADADVEVIIEQARRSAEVTHAHSDGLGGAIAVALAAAFASRQRGQLDEHAGMQLLRFALDHTPDGAVLAGISMAAKLPLDTAVAIAAQRLGDGSNVTAADTVPFCLWCAARHLSDYVEAIWTTVAVGGDIDTNCAIVGGIVALSAGAGGVPQHWLHARETLQFE